jgi:hypothetical protein
MENCEDEFVTFTCKLLRLHLHLSVLNLTFCIAFTLFYTHVYRR